MTYQKMKWIHRENCRFALWLWHWFEGWFFEEIYMWRQVFHHCTPVIWRKNSAALEASCIVFSTAHILQRHCIVLTLYCEQTLLLHSCNQYLSCWKFVDCPPPFEEQILYFEISIVGNSFESFVFLVASHCKRVHFLLKPTPFPFLSLSCWNG